jgi:hypothetical protein
VPDITEAEFDQLVKRTGHRCPKYCHRCPLMPDKSVMPYCMGTINGTDEHSLSRCVCDRAKVRAAAAIGRRVARDELGHENRRLHALVLALADRIHKQHELLARKAER